MNNITSGAEKHLEIMKSGTMSQKIKLLVSPGNALFTRYYDGCLWYEIRYAITNHDTEEELDHKFEFPVPITDIGSATFLRADKALLFMRYIRKHLEMLAQAKEE